MTRRIVVTVLSVGAVAVLGLGIVSFWVDLPGYYTEDFALHMYLADGGLHVVWNTVHTAFTISLGVREWPWGYHVNSGGIHFLFLPFWMPFLVLAAYPAFVLIGWLRRSRDPKEGHCRKCGYDLTGNVSGVCPECGKRIERKA
jgi:hypothetical protein